MNIDLVHTNNEIKERFQQIDTFKNGGKVEIPVIIDEQSKEMLNTIDSVTIDAIGWSYFKKLGIRNRPVRYMGGSC